MTRLVRITGTSRNLLQMPVQPKRAETWLCNDPAKYRFMPPELLRWTRWFNLHSRYWMQRKYPLGLRWYMAQSRTVYMQRQWPDVIPSRAFPSELIQTTYAGPNGPMRYFTATLAWQIALAMVERFDIIELWGFSLTGRYVEQPPCIFYWIRRAQASGIEVRMQPGLAKLSIASGDPTTYTGPLYGYETKPERDLTQIARFAPSEGGGPIRKKRR